MKGQKVLFSHKNDNWETPQGLFDELNKEFNFVVDLAANMHNAKIYPFCSNLDFTESNNHLQFCTTENKVNISLNTNMINRFVWCNPPYSNQRKFIEFVIKHRLNSVFLLPARTDTRLFHELIYPYWSVVNDFNANKTYVKQDMNQVSNLYTTEVRFIKGRLIFKPSEEMILIWKEKLQKEKSIKKQESLKIQIAGKMPCGFPSMIVIFRFD